MTALSFGTSVPTGSAEAPIRRARKLVGCRQLRLSEQRYGLSHLVHGRHIFHLKNGFGGRAEDAGSRGNSREWSMSLAPVAGLHTGTAVNVAQTAPVQVVPDCKYAPTVIPLMSVE